MRIHNALRQLAVALMLIAASFLAVIIASDLVWPEGSFWGPFLLLIIATILFGFALHRAVLSARPLSTWTLRRLHLQ